jgi:hypothetical protein
LGLLVVVAPFGRVVDSEVVATPASKNSAGDSGGKKFGELGGGGQPDSLRGAAISGQKSSPRLTTPERTLLYGLGIRRVLLIIRLPERANIRTSG